MMNVSRFFISLIIAEPGVGYNFDVQSGRADLGFPWGEVIQFNSVFSNDFVIGFDGFSAVRTKRRVIMFMLDTTITGDIITVTMAPSKARDKNKRLMTRYGFQYFIIEEYKCPEDVCYDL